MIPLNGLWLLLTLALVLGARWCFTPAGRRWLAGPPRDQAFASETDGTLWTPGGRP